MENYIEQFTISPGGNVDRDGKSTVISPGIEAVRFRWHNGNLNKNVATMSCPLSYEGTEMLTAFTEKNNEQTKK